ncbi:uncharacterized protein TNCV_1234071 [Trichonephila clavipes]|nr:uncharacterized protein TNCV_1234071 [Trichonephila clavipes]
MVVVSSGYHLKNICFEKVDRFRSEIQLADHPLRGLNAVEKANEVGNREAARFFNVDESNIRLWRRNKTNFENCDRRKRADRRGKPHWPELEAEINKWILKERDDGKAVSTKVMGTVDVRWRKKNYTKTGKLKRASYENVSRWVLKAWNDVAETTVKNAFRKCNIIVKNDSDDEESLLSSDSDVLREDLINLFISESDESDFEGFFNC